jgi:hypothetical protein
VAELHSSARMIVLNCCPTLPSCTFALPAWNVVVVVILFTFTTLNRNTATSTKPFSASARRVQLGATGGRFNTVLTGHLNMPGPPPDTSPATR